MNDYFLFNIERRHLAQEQFTTRSADDVDGASRVIFALNLDFQRHVDRRAAGVPFFGAQRLGHPGRRFSDDQALGELPEVAQLDERIDGGGAALQHGGVEFLQEGANVVGNFHGIGAAFGLERPVARGDGRRGVEVGRRGEAEVFRRGVEFVLLHGEFGQAEMRKPVGLDGQRLRFEGVVEYFRGLLVRLLGEQGAAKQRLERRRAGGVGCGGETFAGFRLGRREIVFAVGQIGLAEGFGLRRAARKNVVRVIALQTDFVGIDLDGFDVDAGGKTDRAVFTGLDRHGLGSLLSLVVCRHDLDREIPGAEIGDGRFHAVGRVLRLADGEVWQSHRNYATSVYNGVDPVVEKLIDEFAVGARGDQVLFEVRAARELAERVWLRRPAPLLPLLHLLLRQPAGQAERVDPAARERRAQRLLERLRAEGPLDHTPDQRALVVDAGGVVAVERTLRQERRVVSRDRRVGAAEPLERRVALSWTEAVAQILGHQIYRQRVAQHPGAAPAQQDLPVNPGPGRRARKQLDRPQVYGVAAEDVFVDRDRADHRRRSLASS